MHAAAAGCSGFRKLSAAQSCSCPPPRTSHLTPSCDRPAFQMGVMLCCISFQFTPKCPVLTTFFHAPCTLPCRWVDVLRCISRWELLQQISSGMPTDAVLFSATQVRCWG